MRNNILTTVIAWTVIILGTLAAVAIGQNDSGRPEPDPYAPNQGWIQQLQNQVAEHEQHIRRLQIDVDILWHQNYDLVIEVDCNRREIADVRERLYDFIRASEPWEPPTY